MVIDEEISSITLRWTSRKFWAMMFWQAVNVMLLYAGKLPVDAFVSLTWLLLGGYFLGNVAQKYIEAKLLV